MPKDLTEPSPLPKARPTEVVKTSQELTGAKRRLINTARPVFWLLFAINTVNFLDRFLAVAVAPTLKTEFHLTDANIGALSSAFILIYTLAALPLGLLADRASRARVVSIGVSLWSVASGLTGVATGLPLLFVTRAGVGIGEASYYPAGTALLSAYYSLERRARILSRWSSGQLVGVALAFAVSAGLSALLGPTVGWRVAFLVSAIPGFLLAALMWFVADGPRNAPAETSSYAEEVNEELPPRHQNLLPRLHLKTAGGVRATLAEYRAQLEPRLVAAAHDLRLILREVAQIRTVWIVAALQALTFLIITPSVTFLPIYLRSSNGPFHLGETVTDGLAGAVIIVGGLSGQLLGGNVAGLAGQASTWRTYSDGDSWLWTGYTIVCGDAVDSFAGALCSIRYHGRLDHQSAGRPGSRLRAGCHARSYEGNRSCPDAAGRSSLRRRLVALGRGRGLDRSRGTHRDFAVHLRYSSACCVLPSLDSLASASTCRRSAPIAAEMMCRGSGRDRSQSAIKQVAITALNRYNECGNCRGQNPT